MTHPSDPRDDLALQLGDIEIVHAPLPPGAEGVGRSSPTADAPIGMAGKFAMTATIIAAGASLYSVVAVLTPTVGSATVAFMMLMVAAYSILGGFMLMNVWRDRSRPCLATPERVGTSFQPIHRRADDLGTPAR